MARPPAKYRCLAHRTTFKTGTGFAAHMRSPRFHPGGSAAVAAKLKKSLTPAPTTNGAGHTDAPPASTAVTHLESALALVQQKIFNTNSEFLKLNKQRDNIIAALGEDHIPF